MAGVPLASELPPAPSAETDDLIPGLDDMFADMS